MLRNYVNIAVRSLLKNKLYSGINLFGLALGIACTLLIGLWVKDELSYNRFLPNSATIYLVRVNYVFDKQKHTSLVTPGPLSDALTRDIPEIDVVTKTSWEQELLVKAANGPVGANEQGHFVSSDFFSVFEIPALAGNPTEAIRQPDKIIITAKLADKYFPATAGHYEQALGKTLQLDHNQLYTVGAVLQNLPSNSTITFDWLINWKAQEEAWMNEWGMNSFMTYVRLKPKATVAQTEASMKGIFPRYAKFNNQEAPILQPITDLHLYSDYADGQVVGGLIRYVQIFSAVALFILLIACINFINLATARSAIRAKEVGIRKVVGALRSSLIGQFMGESILTSLLATGLAIGLVALILPAFNAEFDKQLTLRLTDPMLWLIIVGLLLLTGFLSGSYPALFLSALSPISTLKGRLQSSTGSALFRRTLVVFQFSLSIFLIIGMVAVGRQMNFLLTKNLGLDRENIVYVPLEGAVAYPHNPTTFQQEVMQLPSVASATVTGHLPVDIHSNTTDLHWPGQPVSQLVSVSTMAIGPDFTRTMGVKLLAGRDFMANNRSDSTNYLINETAATLMGMTNPVGREITFSPGKGRIVGLMKDFHLSSLHQAIEPLVLTFNSQNTRYLLVKTRTGQTSQAIADLERITKSFNPDYPFTYSFLDEDYEKLYRSEQQVRTLINSFGGLAILISCLGLFALAAFTAEQRTKEIGVRKVLGASVASIIGLLSKDFLKLVLIALVLASPLAWWALSQWLDTFAYKTDLPWWVFAVAGLLAISIALVTVSFQSIKAALINPVKSLRSE